MLSIKKSTLFKVPIIIIIAHFMYIKNTATIRVHKIQYNGTSNDQNVSIYFIF